MNKFSSRHKWVLHWYFPQTGFENCICWHFSPVDTTSLCDETKILTDTETETFYPRQIFPIPIPRLFFRDQIIRDRYRDFFSETKFSNTDTETFLTRPNFSIPIPRLFFRDQNFWYRYRDSQKIVTGLETETETETFASEWQLITQNFYLISPLFLCNFFSETKFSDTDTKKCFPRPNFLIPIPRLF